MTNNRIPWNSASKWYNDESDGSMSVKEIKDSLDKYSAKLIYDNKERTYYLVFDDIEGQMLFAMQYL